MSSIRPPARRRAPGAVVAVFTAVVAFGITCAAIDWWPGVSHRVDAWTNLLILVVLGVLLLAAGLVWAVKTFNVVVRERRWSWWIIPAPAMVIAAFGVVLLVPAPSFQSARTDFEAAVRQFTIPPQTTAVSDVDIGPFTMTTISAYPGGTIYFHHADLVFFRATGGWVYSPGGTPRGDEYYEKFEATHIDGPWYEFRGTRPGW